MLLIYTVNTCWTPHSIGICARSKKEGVLYPEEIFRTKDEVLKDAEHVRASGYGTYSGRKVWQMPQKITRQIRRLLGDKYTCVYDDSWE
jgi:hypothetical protein